MTLIDSFVAFKQRMQYAFGYLGMVTMPLLLVDLIQKKLALVGIQISFALLFIGSLIGLYIAGMIGDKMGLWEKENDYNYARQKAMREDMERRNA